MPAFFTAGHLRLSLLLAVLGTLIALIFTILSASSTVSLIVRPIVSGLLMFVLGSGIYALLAKKVPEAIDVIENNAEPLPEGMADDAGMSSDEMGSEGSNEGAEYSNGEGNSTLDSYDTDAGSSTMSNIPRKTGITIGKDEIVVNGVKFKNQPEVMAETIKQLMEQDKE